MESLRRLPGFRSGRRRKQVIATLLEVYCLLGIVAALTGRNTGSLVPYLLLLGAGVAIASRFGRVVAVGGASPGASKDDPFRQFRVNDPEQPLGWNTVLYLGVGDLGATKNIACVANPEDSMAIVGPPRVGKTAGLLIPQILTWNGP